MTPQERLQQHIDEHTLVRGEWGDGHHTACLLAALHPACANEGSRGGPEVCPAHIMPQWLAKLTPTMNDDGSYERWPALIQRYADVANRWHVLAEQEWEAVRVRILVLVLTTLERRLTAGKYLDAARFVGSARDALEKGSDDHPKTLPVTLVFHNYLRDLLVLSAHGARIDDFLDSFTQLECLLGSEEASDEDVQDDLNDTILSAIEEACDAKERGVLG